MVLIHTLTAPVVPASSTAISTSGQRNVNYGREQVPLRNRAPVRVPVYVAASSQEPGTTESQDVPPPGCARYKVQVGRGRHPWGAFQPASGGYHVQRKVFQ
jgi:hypothetical protein